MLATQADKRLVQMGIGVVMVVGATALSYATYVGAVNSGGGSYVIFTGLIGYGCVNLVRGYRGLGEVRERQLRLSKLGESH